MNLVVQVETALPENRMDEIRAAIHAALREHPLLSARSETLHLKVIVSVGMEERTGIDHRAYPRERSVRLHLDEFYIPLDRQLPSSRDHRSGREAALAAWHEFFRD